MDWSLSISFLDSDWFLKCLRGLLWKKVFLKVYMNLLNRFCFGGILILWINGVFVCWGEDILVVESFFLLFIG